MKALIVTFVAVGLTAYLTRTWEAGDAAAAMVGALLVSVAVVSARTPRAPIEEPDRQQVIAALKRLKHDEHTSFGKPRW